jgi:anti-anti-sigma factor
VIDKRRSERGDSGGINEFKDQLRETFDSLMEGCQIIGYDWRYKYVNDAVAKHGRTTKERLLGRTMMEAYPGIEKTELFSVLQKCMSDRIATRMENEFQYPDGKKGWFELNIQPAPQGIVILSVDITERKRAEEKLKVQMQELRDREDMIGKLSTPIVEIENGIALLPLVGVLDKTRARQLTESILEHIAKEKIDMIVMDVTGIASMDTQTANHIIRTVQAVRLMGSDIIVTGIRPEVAATLVALGINLSEITTCATLREGLQYAYTKMGLKLSKE